MNKFVLTIFLAFVVATTGCAQQITKRDAGLGIGAVTGALLGNTVGKGHGREVATVAGAIAGAYLGSAIGQYMDSVDRLRMNQALETAPDRTSHTWSNRQTGIRYAVTPTRTFDREAPCREYTTQAVIGGRTETIYGTACRQPDGSWQVST